MPGARKNRVPRPCPSVLWRGRAGFLIFFQFPEISIHCPVRRRRDVSGTPKCKLTRGPAHLFGGQSLAATLSLTPPAPFESPPQSPPSAPASAPPTPPPPLPVPKLQSPNTAPQCAHSHPIHSRQHQSPAAPPAPAQTESSPAPAHSESSAETPSDRRPTPRASSANAQSRP